MKAFEENFTAWVDGKLTGDELAAFERELAQNPEAAAERDAALKLGDFLRTHAAGPRLANADFFNARLMQQIEAETPTPQVGAGREKTRQFRSLPWLVWAGVSCLVVSLGLFRVTIPKPSEEKSAYFAQVIESWPADDSITATTVYNPDDNITVLWLDGLDYVPASYHAQ